MNQYEIDYKQGYDNANDEWLERIDKIRTEIDQLPFYAAKFADGAFAIHVDKEKVLQIIDKYKTESEDK